jgi:hypothetical protein
MNLRFVAVVLTMCQVLINSTPLFAQDEFGSLTRPEKRAYHACLYAHWIDGYCRFHAWGFNGGSFRECVVANGGCECVVANRGYWGPDVDDACWAVGHAHRL